jgi:hypothetical protein
VKGDLWGHWDIMVMMAVVIEEKGECKYRAIMDMEGS